MLTATRREWNELYVFFNLLAQGGIVLGNEEGLPSGRVLPIFQVTRQEHDGERRYTVEETDIHVEGHPTRASWRKDGNRCGIPRVGNCCHEK